MKKIFSLVTLMGVCLSTVLYSCSNDVISVSEETSSNGKTADNNPDGSPVKVVLNKQQIIGLCSAYFVFRTSTWKKGKEIKEKIDKLDNISDISNFLIVW